MRRGYNTNGFAHHRLADAIEILARIGYRSIAITLDHRALNPYAEDFAGQRRTVAKLLEQHGLTCVIETGARFLLDARRKHWPTLLSGSENDRVRRRDFLLRAIDLAAVLGADAVSFWSGACPPDLSAAPAMDRLVDECCRLADAAERQKVRLAFEPEPGMFIDTMARFSEVHEKVDHPRFGLTLDVGHVHCLADGTIGEHLRRWRSSLFNVHLDDAKRGVHEHLMFGEGEMDIAGVMADLQRIDFSLGVHVELSRHSHQAVEAARRAYDLLTETMST